MLPPDARPSMPFDPKSITTRKFVIPAHSVNREDGMYPVDRKVVDLIVARNVKTGQEMVQVGMYNLERDEFTDLRNGEVREDQHLNDEFMPTPQVIFLRQSQDNHGFTAVNHERGRWEPVDSGDRWLRPL